MREKDNKREREGERERDRKREKQDQVTDSRNLSQGFTELSET